jgi:hypothetical protein
MFRAKTVICTELGRDLRLVRRRHWVAAQCAVGVRRIDGVALAIVWLLVEKGREACARRECC